MNRRVYIICQKKNWEKGRPQVLSDGMGKLEYIYAGEDGLSLAKHRMNELNKDKGLHPVHIRKGMLIIEEELKHCVNAKTSESQGGKNGK